MKTEYNILRPFVPCSAHIFLDEKGRTSTYCMRERGHEDEGIKGFPGGHNIVNAAPVEGKDGV
jgi:hypothetical protein